MATPLHLNTMVNGSVGTCHEAADWLASRQDRAGNAADQAYRARNASEAEWRGPAGEAFRASANPVASSCLDLEETCKIYARAFREFADTLESVLREMHGIISRASSGGLDVQGPFVMRPEHPGSPPEFTIGIARPGEAVDLAYLRAKAQEAYTSKVSDYNAKVQVFNECLARYKDARNKEKQAHINLRESLGTDRVADLDGWKLGNTTASAVIGTIGSAENARYETIVKADRLAGDARTFQLLAAGKLPLGDLTAKQRTQLMMAAAKAGVQEDAYKRKVRELDRLLKKTPQWLRESAAHYPGKSPGVAVPPADASAAQKGASAVLKQMPYVGSSLVAVNEGARAATGEQTWGKAVAKTTGTIAGSGAGGWGGAALCAPLFPPWGSLVCGGAGSVVGGITGSAVVDYYLPDDAGFPEPVRNIHYRGAHE